MTSFFNKLSAIIIGAFILSAPYAYAQDYPPGTRVLKDGLGDEVSLSVQAELLDPVFLIERSNDTCVAQGSLVMEEETCEAINNYIAQPTELVEFDIVVIEVNFSEYSKIVDEWGITIGGSSSVILSNGDYRINGNATQWAQAVPKNRTAPLSMQVVGMNGGIPVIVSSVYTLKPGEHVFEYDEVLSHAYDIDVNVVDTVSIVFERRGLGTPQPISSVHEFVHADTVVDHGLGYFIKEGDSIIDDKPQEVLDDRALTNKVVDSPEDTTDSTNQTSSSSDVDTEDEPELSFVEKYKKLYREDPVLAILFGISLLSAIAPTVSFPFIYLHGKKRRVEQV